MEKSNHYGKIIEEIFLEAFKKNTLHFLATILRFDGMSIGHWDTLEEAKDTFTDLSVLLEEANNNGNRKRETKIALLMYCHAIEMTHVHQILANILRICAGRPFKFRALWDDEYMKRLRKKKSIFFPPPTLGNKLKQLEQLASEAEKGALVSAFNDIFDLKIRNSFSHSDYCIDIKNEFYRYTEGGPAQQIKLNDLENILNKAFEFYSEFFRVLEAWHYETAKMVRYHKLPEYQVLELLTDNGRLFGFSIHHSNGSKSTFERTKSKVNICNFDIIEEGIGVFVGNIDKLKKSWYVDNIEITDFEEINKNAAKQNEVD